MVGCVREQHIHAAAAALSQTPPPRRHSHSLLSSARTTSRLRAFPGSTPTPTQRNTASTSVRTQRTHARTSNPALRTNSPAVYPTPAMHQGGTGGDRQQSPITAGLCARQVRAPPDERATADGSTPRQHCCCQLMIQTRLATKLDHSMSWQSCQGRQGQLIPTRQCWLQPRLAGVTDVDHWFILQPSARLSVCSLISLLP